MIIATAASLFARIGTEVQIDWLVTLLFAAGSALGGMLGGPLSARARPSTLTILFAVLLAAVAAVSLLETLVLGRTEDLVSSPGPPYVAFPVAPHTLPA